MKTGKYKSRREAARAHGISPSTFNARANGGRSIAEAHQTRQLLTPAQEEGLVNHIKLMDAMGYPLSHEDVRESAQLLLRSSHMTDVTALGDSWVQRFLHRHPSLESKYSRTIENGCIEFQREEIIRWFAKV